MQRLGSNFRWSMKAKIIECPRDAMQGLSNFIETKDKIDYINQLLKVGFDTIDFGSFVSPKAIPQMRDTAEVLEELDLANSQSELLTIVANVRGAKEALLHSQIDYLGFPMSISATFQQRNTNQSITQALETLSEIQEACIKSNKQLVTYLSMGFGNPYNDPYHTDIVKQFVEILIALDIKIVSISDTIGVAEPKAINGLMSSLLDEFKDLEFGVHLHSRADTAAEKIMAAVTAGCSRFDGAIMGLGGCPMAEDELVGNINTRTLIDTLDQSSLFVELDQKAFDLAEQKAKLIFN